MLLSLDHPICQISRRTILESAGSLSEVCTWNWNDYFSSIDQYPVLHSWCSISSIMCFIVLPSSQSFLSQWLQVRGCWIVLIEGINIPQMTLDFHSKVIPASRTSLLSAWRDFFNNWALKGEPVHICLWFQCILRGLCMVFSHKSHIHPYLYSDLPSAVR